MTIESLTDIVMHDPTGVMNPIYAWRMGPNVWAMQEMCQQAAVILDDIDMNGWAYQYNGLGYSVNVYSTEASCLEE